MKRCLCILTLFAVIFWGVWYAMAADRIPVVVTIVPQQYMVQQIGKDLVDVQVMVPPGADVHTYEPKPRQMVAISRAKLYFTVGVAFEKRWLNKIHEANPSMRIIHTDIGIKKIPMVSHHHHGKEASLKDVEHSEPLGHTGHAHDRRERAGQEHAGLDPHIWLSPPNVMMQARTIVTALQLADGVHRSMYEENYRSFMSELMTLDADLRAVFAEKHGLAFMVFHPAWGYFAQAYGLRQIPVEIEGKEPKPAQLAELIEHARQRQIKIVFTQPQISSRSAEQIAREIDGTVVPVDPMAQNWSENLRSVAQRIQEALK